MTLPSRVEALDEKKNKFESSSSWNRMNSNCVQITFTFSPPANANVGKPTKLMFHAWHIVPHQLRFEFKDLPLP
jgi:hypothetical protein